MATTKKRTYEFDEQKLQKLSEPITVTVHKLVNGAREPVILPTKPEEGVPGRGWSADDVRMLDEFISTKWEGAGHYELSAVGSNGEKLEWKSYFPETRYPALHRGQPVAPAPSQQAQVATHSAPAPATAASSWMSGIPAPVFPPPVPPLGSPWNGGHMTPWSSPPPYTYGHYGSAYGASSPLGAGSEAQKAREEVLKVEARLERERQESAHKADMATMSQELRRVQESLAKPQGDSEEVKLLRQEIAALQQRSNDDKFVRMIEDSKRENREMMQQLQQQHQQAMQQMQAALAAKPTGPDPTMMLVVESMKQSSQMQAEASRAQVEAQKEIARLQAETQREAAKNAMAPRDMFDMISRLNVNQEQLATGYAKVFELWQQGMETIMSAQGPSTHPALEMIGQGVQGGLGVAQQYIEMKQNEAMANAQARAVEAQAQAAAATAHQRPGQVIGQPALGAPTSATPPDNVAAVETDEEAVARPSASELAAKEAELFGPALDAVRGLRARVKSGMAQPEQVAAAILQGIDHFVGQGAVVPAFDLWAEGELAQLVECLIPAAPTSFQERVIEHLFAVRQQALQQKGQAQPQAEGTDGEAA